MNDQANLQQFESINTWKSKGIRAPYKPLLMLPEPGVIQGGYRLFPYATIEPMLTELLMDLWHLRKLT